MSDFYDASGAPASHSFGYSSQMRAEFSAIGAAFDKLPALSGNATKILRVNAAGTAVEVVDASTLTGLTEAEADARYLQLTGGNVSGLVTSTSVEALRVARDSGYIDFYDDANSVQTGYLQFAKTTAINLYSSVAIPIVFGTNGNERMRIDASGDINIGGAVTAGSFAGPLTGTVTGNASSASAVAWTGVTGRPTNVSAFTNDAGYLTSVGTISASSLSGSTLASGVTASSLTSLGTLGSLSVSGTASAGAFSGPLTGNVTGNVSGSSGSCTGNAATATSATSATSASTATTATNVSGGSVSCTTVSASGLIKGNGGGSGLGAITVSASAPSGGSDGDIWLQT